MNKEADRRRQLKEQVGSSKKKREKTVNYKSRLIRLL